MQISNQTFSGERPLYNSRDLRLERITIGEGESGLKECRRINAIDCRFSGQYILWECEDIACRQCTFESPSRASLWYVRRLSMSDCTIHSPKAFREINDLRLDNIRITNSGETFWACRNGQLTDISMEGGIYPFMRASDLHITRLHMTAKYAFQYARNMEIHHAVLHTKDAFWESDHCTIYDSEIHGEYLAWYSRNLRLVRCHISGTQPLCYCDNLVLEDCTFAPDADLAFEYSSVQATILSPVTSIKNPRSGHISCCGCGELLRDEHAKAPNDCVIQSSRTYAQRIV